MNDNDYQFFSDHSYQLPADIFTRCSQFVNSQIGSIISVLTEVIGEGDEVR